MIVRTGTGLLAIVVLILVLGLGVLYSTAGNRYLVSLAEDALAPALSVSGVDGSLLNTLCAEEVVFEQPGLRVVVREVCISVKLWASVDFLNLSFEHVEAGEVNIQTSEGSAEESSEPIQLPLVILVDELQVARLVVNELTVETIDAVLAVRNSDLAVQATLRYAEEAVRISTGGPWTRFQVEAAALNTALNAQLNLHADDLPWTLEATAPSFDLTPFAGRDLSLSNAHLSGAGNLQDYEFQIEALVQDQLVAGHVSGAGAGDRAGLSLERLTLSEVSFAEIPVAVDTLTAVGRLRWLDSFSARFEDISARGTVTDRALRVTLSGLTLDPARIALDEGVVQLVEAAGGRLEMNGEMGFDGALGLTVEALNLPLMLADERLAGEVTATSTVNGSIEAPTFEGQFALSELAWEGRAIGDLEGRVTGSPDAGKLIVSLSASQGAAQTETTYALADGNLTLGVQSLNLSVPELQAKAALEAPTDLLFGDRGLSLGETCFRLETEFLEGDAGRVCGSVDYPNGGLTLRFDPWQLPPVEYPDSEIAVSGVVALTLDLESFSPVSGRAELLLSELIAHHSEMAPIELGELGVKARVQDDVAVLELATPADKIQNLRLDGAISSQLAPELTESTLSGELTAQLDGIWVAETLLPMDLTFELEGIEGVLRVKTVFAGTLWAPLVNGSLALTDAGWQVLAVNSTFSDFDLDATLHESDRISFSSEGSVGEGRLKVSGNMVGLGEGAPRLTTRFELDDAGVLNLPDYQAILGGDVELDMGRSDLSLTGALKMPRARIIIAELPESAVSASADEIIVDADISATTQQIRTTDLQLTLGNDVRLDAFGLTARLSGNLRVVEAPGRLRSVTGVINLREGLFEAYGQKLELERGQLTFTGLVDDPTVDVTATRTVSYEERDYRISLVISGTAKNLRTTVLSQPSLPEDDALALLITGQTFSQMSSSEQTNVSGAALSLGLLGASRVTQNLASALQLEEIILDQDAEGNMEVGAAVRLRRDIYLRYTYGVFSRIGGVLLRYRISKRISVQAVTGDAHSIEVRYGVDE